MFLRPASIAAKRLCSANNCEISLQRLQTGRQPGNAHPAAKRGSGGRPTSGSGSGSGSRSRSSGGKRADWVMASTATGSLPAAIESADPAAMLMQHLAIPPAPNFQPLGACVEHLLAPCDSLLSEVVSRELQLPQGAAELLLRYGAIHACAVPPPLQASMLAAMPPEQAAELQRKRQEALQRAGNSTQARTPQRVTQDVVVSKHSYIRVHLHPKRFPAAYSVNWADRVVACTDDFVVVSKPAGVPAAPTVDNILESAPACTAQAVGQEQPLLVTHRLDQCTEGVLVLGRTKQFVARFNELMKRGSSKNGSSSSNSSAGSAAGGGNAAGAAPGQQQQLPASTIANNNDDGIVSGGGSQPAATAQPQSPPLPPPLPALRKFYRAATSAHPPLGLLRHYLSTERRQVGLPCYTIAHEEEVEGSLLAELRVLEVQPIRLNAHAAQLWASQQDDLVTNSSGTGTSASTSASSSSPSAPAAAGPAASAAAHFECVIELLTGRTHQIRAQLSAVGCPLLGDTLYAPLASPELRQRLFAGQVPEEELVGEPGGQGERRLLCEPAGGIGLQACKLEVRDSCMGGSAERPAVFEAGTPWWRVEQMG